MNKNETTSNPLSSEYDTTISLLNLYYSESNYRSQVLWSQIFRFYYAILIIILLPNMSTFFQITLPNIPIIVFRIIGILLSFSFLYVSFGYAIRLQAINDTYQNLLDELPKKYHRKSIKDIGIGKIFMPRISYVLCFSLFLSLFFLSIILIIF